MPRAIADSDDDGDSDILVNGDEANVNDHTPKVAMDEPNGTNEARSTGSTEILRRQLLSAEQGLMANSAPAAQRGSASSPLDHDRKRRHTTISGFEPTGSPDTAVKRLKRVQTYGHRSRRTVLDDEDEDEAMEAPAQSARFSQDSRFRYSVELPNGPRSIERDFLNHEPAVMFRESGSTIEDSPATMQRMFNQALEGRDMMATSQLALEVAPEKLSSSLGWLSESQQTPAGNGRDGGGDNASRKAENGLDGGEEYAGIAKGSIHPSNGSVQDGDPNTKEEHSTTAAAQTHGEEHPSRTQEPQVTPSPQLATDQHRHSPMVEITTTTTTKAVSQPDSTSVPASTKSRRRKSQTKETDSEPLNSDDKAIGLPKERYVPRPSRRRANAALEEPIDYSVAPEKAAKMKRTKSTQAFAKKADAELDEVIQPIPVPTVDATPQDPELMHMILNALGGKKDQKEVEAAVTDTPFSPKPAQADKDPSRPKCERLNHGPEAIQPKGRHQPTQHQASSPTAEKPKEPDHVFAKPAMPPPKAKPASKAKRAQTTIFEDHVEFLGSQRSSPSLSQQQAKRKSALQTTKDVKAPPSSRKRRMIVQDDEDDEDELATAEDHEEVQSQPKKRGRGRPAKSSTKPKAKSAETVRDESDGEDDAEIEVAPKKVTKGRPSHSNNDHGKENEPVVSTAASADSHGAEVIDTSGTSILSTTVSTPQKPHSSFKELPTPSPEKTTVKEGEKQVEKPAATTLKSTKASPTSHTPLKSSSKVPHRVGLSKMHRIPPLLRMMRPPKP